MWSTSRLTFPGITLVISYGDDTIPDMLQPCIRVYSPCCGAPMDDTIQGIPRGYSPFSLIPTCTYCGKSTATVDTTHKVMFQDANSFYRSTPDMIGTWLSQENPLKRIVQTGEIMLAIEKEIEKVLNFPLSLLGEAVVSSVDSHISTSP